MPTASLDVVDHITEEIVVFSECVHDAGKIVKQEFIPFRVNLCYLISNDTELGLTKPSIPCPLPWNRYVDERGHIFQRPRRQTRRKRIRYIHGEVSPRAESQVNQTYHTSVMS